MTKRKQPLSDTLSMRLFGGGINRKTSATKKNHATVPTYYPKGPHPEHCCLHKYLNAESAES